MTAYGYGDKITNTIECNGMESSIYSEIVFKGLDELCKLGNNSFSFCDENGYRGNKYLEEHHIGGRGLNKGNNDKKDSDKGDNDKKDSGQGDSDKGDSSKGDSGKGDSGKGDSGERDSDNGARSGGSRYSFGKRGDEKDSDNGACSYGVCNNLTVGKGNSELDFGGGGRCFGGGSGEHGGGSCLTY